MVQDQLAALLGGTVTDTVDLELLLVALADADHHVVEQRAGQAVESAVFLLIVGTRDVNNAGFLGDESSSG